MSRPVVWKTFDGNGNVLAIRDPTGHVTKTEYDAYSRPVRVDAAYGTDVQTTTRTGYDVAGNVLFLELDNAEYGLQRTSYAYNANNQKIEEQLPTIGGVLRRTTWEYTLAGLVRRVVDPMDRETTQTYNRFGEIESVQNASVKRVTTYSFTGKVLKVDEMPIQVGAGSRSTNYVYDAGDRVVMEKRNESGVETTVESGYDILGNRTLTRYQVNGVGAQTTRTLRSTYDAAGRLATIVDSDGNARTAYAYDASGNRRNLERPNGVFDTYIYDAANRLLATLTDAAQADGSPVKTVYSAAYEYDLTGNRISVEEFTQGLSTRRMVYEYDAQHRLVGESLRVTTGETSGPESKTTWTFDRAGNRLRQVVRDNAWDGGWSELETSYAYDQLNRLLSRSAKRTTYMPLGQVTDVATGLDRVEYAYDRSGNRTVEADLSARRNRVYSYDTFNRLQSVHAATVQTTSPPNLEHNLDRPAQVGEIVFRAEYDERTRRRLTVEVVDGAPVQTVFRYDGGDCYQEIVDQRSSVIHIRGSGLGGGIGSILYTDRRGASVAGPVETFVYNPVAGHVVATVTPNGAVQSSQVYDAYGNIRAKQGISLNNRLANTKERSLSIELDNHGFRYYDPGIGRYISRDPIGYEDGPNVYLSVHNNPINHIDPLGLKTLPDGTVVPDDEPPKKEPTPKVTTNPEGGGEKKIIRRFPAREADKEMTEAERLAHNDRAAKSEAEYQQWREDHPDYDPNGEPKKPEVYMNPTGAKVLKGAEILLGAVVVPGGALGELAGGVAGALGRAGVTILEREGQLVVGSFRVAKGEAQFMGKVFVKGDTLFVDGAHIAGNGTLREAQAVAIKAAQEAGCARVVVQGAARTTGAAKGHVPRPITWEVPKP